MLNNQKILFDFLDAIRKEVIIEQERQNRVASGKSVDGYQVESTNVLGTFSGVSYSGTLETGRKPGKVPQGFSLIILEWMNQKSLHSAESEAKRKSIAYLIARKISREGTTLHRQGGKSGVFTNVITEERLRQFSDKLLTSFQNETINEILFQFAA